MIVPTTTAELIAMSLAMMINLGSSEPAVVGYKWIYENGIYNAADDEDYYGNPLDGYNEVDVEVSSTPYIMPIKVTANGTYVNVDYDCDAFDPVTVDVGSEFDFCDKPGLIDITPIIDEEYFVYDRDWGYGLVCEIQDNGHRLYVGKANKSRSYDYQIYSNVTDLVYGSAWISSMNSSTGEFVISYTFTYSPGTVRTIRRTRSELIGYGASGHRFTAVKK